MWLATYRSVILSWGVAGTILFAHLPRSTAAELDPLLAEIERQPVASTHLLSVGYHPGKQVLEIEFQNGDVYRYLAVPPAIAQGLHGAASKGRYFARVIRGRFKFQLVIKGKP